MSLRWFEGFETYQEEVTFLTKYTGAGTVYQGGETFVSGRVFGSAIRADPGTQTIFELPAQAAQSSWTCGIAFKSASTIYAGDDWWLFRLSDGATEQVSLWLADGATSGTYVLQVRQDATILGVSKEFPASGEWRYVEWQVVHSATVGTVEVRLDGVVVLTLSGIDTAPSGSADSDTISFGMGADVGNFDIDDVYILDDQGSDIMFQSFLGPVVVQGFRPVEDASPNEMTPSTGSDHFAVVDDAVSVSSPESDYLEGSGGDQEFFGLGSAGVVQGGVLGARLDVISLLDGAGSETLTAYHRRKRRGSTQDPAQSIGSDTIDSTTIMGSSFVVQADPFNGERLSIEDVEHGSFGVEAT